MQCFNVHARRLINSMFSVRGKQTLILTQQVKVYQQKKLLIKSIYILYKLIYTVKKLISTLLILESF